MRETKKVTYKALKEGQKIKGYDKNGLSCSFTAYVKSSSISGVVVNKWSPNGAEEIIPSNVLFEIEMTDEELLRKYDKNIKELLNSIQNKLTKGQIGYKEQWNSWLYGDIAEMAAYTVKDKFKIVGYSEDITPKTSFITMDTYDLAVCGEYDESHERFWCHYSYSNLKNLLERNCARYNVSITDELKEKFASLGDGRKSRRGVNKS